MGLIYWVQYHRVSDNISDIDGIRRNLSSTMIKFTQVTWRWIERRQLHPTWRVHAPVHSSIRGTACRSHAWKVLGHMWSIFRFVGLSSSSSFLMTLTMPLGCIVLELKNVKRLFREFYWISDEVGKILFSTSSIHMEVSTGVYASRKCIHRWIFQYPMMIEPCFHFLNTLPEAGEAL